MSTVIKNGTIVTADLTYKADVLIEDGRIAAIGDGLSGDRVLDATGCYVMPGGIDPHTHLEMPFMGTYSADDFESGTRAALAGETTMVVDFALPSPGQGLLDALQMWDNKSGRAHCDYSYHMAVTWWGQQVFDEMAAVTAQPLIHQNRGELPPLPCPRAIAKEEATSEADSSHGIVGRGRDHVASFIDGPRSGEIGTMRLTGIDHGLKLRVG